MVCGLGIESLGEQFAPAHVEVKGQFVIDFGGDMAGSETEAKGAAKGGQAGTGAVAETALAIARA
jgi:hypothetical protein